MSQICLASEQDTKELAIEMADRAKIGDCLALHGNLGAGKSTFARYFIKHLIPEITEVPSPTFTIMQQYDNNILHIDCYRLESPEDAINIGMLEEIPHSISLIEWPEIIENLLPRKTQHLYFYIENDTHWVRESL